MYVLLFYQVDLFDANINTAAIFGVGTNVAYVEDTAKITKLGRQTSARMIVNTELGGYSNVMSHVSY